MLRHARLIVILAGLSCLAAPAGPLQAAPPPFPSWTQVKAEVQGHFHKLRDYQTGDIIAQKDVTPLFGKLELIGWKVAEAQEITSKVLPESHFLVQQLRENWGRPLMRRVATQKLIYDHLDRVSQAEGGQKLIHDLPKLPDAEKATGYLTDLLPKRVGGRTRKLQDYDQPTGMIYTENDLLKQLESLYQKASVTTKSSPARRK